MTDWDSRFMDLALHIANWSKDQTTKVGCVIVGPENDVRALGYNGFPRGINDQEPLRHSRPEKYLWTEHAERNAIYNAAQNGVALRDCRMYLPWFPCMDCARAIVQCGLRELIAFPPNYEDPRWGAAFRSSVELFEEAAVGVRFLSRPEDGG